MKTSIYLPSTHVNVTIHELVFSLLGHSILQKFLNINRNNFFWLVSVTE